MTGGAANRLRLARERAGLTREELAARIGVTLPWYHDLEAHDTEVETTVSLAQLRDLGAALGSNPLAIVLGDAATGSRAMSPEDLASEVRRRVAASGRSVDEIGLEVGWDIGPLLRNPSALWQFNVAGLRDVCAYAGVDWTAFLMAPSIDK